MSAAEVDRLVRAFQQDSHLLEEFRGLGAEPGQQLEWVREKGFEVTAEELEKLCGSDHILSDDELEQVAGGDDGWSTGPGPGGTGGGGG